MAQVYGQIEPLKQIRERLNLKGIDRFNSIREIDAFLESFEDEKISVYNYYEKENKNDIRVLEEKIRRHHDISNTITEEKVIEINAKISRNSIVLNKYRSKNPKFFLTRFFIFLLCKLLVWRVNYLQKNHDRFIHKSTKKIRKEITRYIKKKNELDLYSEEIIKSKSAKEINDLNFIKEVVEELRPTIVGAIGENKVVNEIKKLSDDNILINDFSLNFEPPIYNKKEKDRIHSIQIDHLLITKAGVFILETKNWSKHSINSYSLWSPIDQIRRTNYALFILLKKKKIRLKWHHWGEKQIPIRNVVVMINEKPKEEFKYVKVQTLKDLNGYISYFPPIFNDSELTKISNYFIKLSH